MGSIRTGITSTILSNGERSSHRQATEPHGQDYFFWMKRDNQRSKVYQAESVFGWGEKFGAKGRLSELSAYEVISRLETSELLAEYTTHPKYFSPVLNLKGRRSGGYYCPKSGIHGGARTHTYVMIHEWAHHAVTVTLGDIHEPHGAEFVRCLLDAVHAILGIEAFKALTEEMAVRNVKVANMDYDFVPRMFGGPRSRGDEVTE